jgi:hypothetical protein
MPSKMFFQRRVRNNSQYPFCGRMESLYKTDLSQSLKEIDSPNFKAVFDEEIASFNRGER